MEARAAAQLRFFAHKAAKNGTSAEGLLSKTKRRSTCSVAALSCEIAYLHTEIRIGTKNLRQSRTASLSEQEQKRTRLSSTHP